MSADWEHAPVALLAVDASGTVLRANRTAADWLGATREELLAGRRLSDHLTVAGRVFWETHLSPLLITGEPVAEVALELLGATGRLPVLLSARPGEDGSTLLALASASHRAEQERQVRSTGRAATAAASALRGLQTATAALSAAVGVAAVGQAAVTSAVEALGAGAAQLWVLGHDHLELVAACGSDPVARSAAPGIPSGTRAVVEEDDVLVALRGRSRVQGVLRVTARRDAGADPLEADLVEALGLQTGVALERAVVYERSDSIAHQLQQSLLAAPLPRDPRFTLASTYRPAEVGLDVGGDWYDAFLDDAGRLSFLVGDVVGHGLGAAAAMGQLRSAVRAVAGGRVAPSALLARLDRFVADVPAADMATLAYGVLDLVTGELRHACAGHLPPLLVPARGSPRLLWDGRGMPLSGFLGEVRSEARVEVAAGDRLVMCTDGLIERRHRSLDDGLRALVAVAESLRGATPAHAVQELTHRLLVDEVVRDDVCVLLVDVHGLGGPQPAGPHPSGAHPAGT